MRYPSIFTEDKRIIPYKEWTQRLPKGITDTQLIKARNFYYAQHLKNTPRNPRAPIQYLHELPLSKSGKCYVIEENGTNYDFWIEILSKYHYYYKGTSEDPGDISPYFRMMNKGGDKFLGDLYLEEYMRDGPTIKELIFLRYTLEKYLIWTEANYNAVSETNIGYQKTAMLMVRNAKLLIKMYLKMIVQIVPKVWAELLEMQLYNLNHLKVGKSKLNYCRYQYQKFCKMHDVAMVKVPKWNAFSIYIEYCIKTDPEMKYEDFWNGFFDLGKYRTEDDQNKILKLYGTDDAYERKTNTGKYAAFVPKEERLVAYRKPTGKDAW